MLEQIPFGAYDFAVNPDPRVACVLLLDTSGSMSGQPIAELNAGLAAYRGDLAADTLASRRVEVGVVTFGGDVRVLGGFCPAPAFVPPTLSASGGTPMGAAITEGLGMLRRRKEEYKAAGVLRYRPWVFLVTDGQPTDSWEGLVPEIARGEREAAFSFFAVGVSGADFGVLEKLSPARPPVRLDGLKFREMFLWLSASHKAVSRSSPADNTPLPGTLSAWGSVRA